jgi:hypothetical protein
MPRELKSTLSETEALARQITQHLYVVGMTAAESTSELLPVEQVIASYLEAAAAQNLKLGDEARVLQGKVIVAAQSASKDEQYFRKLLSCLRYQVNPQAMAEDLHELHRGIEEWLQAKSFPERMRQDGKAEEKA